MAETVNPFKQPEAASQEAASEAVADQAQDAGQVSQEALQGQVEQEPAQVQPEAPVSEPEAPVVEVQPEVPVQSAPTAPAAPEPVVEVDKSKFTKEEAKAYIAKQFEAGIPVYVIALQDGEHPKSSQWKRAGSKFKLEKAELYSHRWMKLA